MMFKERTVKESMDPHTSEETPQGMEDKASDAVVREDDLQATIDRLQRLQAEFENYKKRADREACLHEQRVSDRVILDFLPLYDNLQRAFQSLEANHDVQTFVAGIEQIFAQFQQILESKAVLPIEATHKPFDPELHEAMLSVPSDTVKKNCIVEEICPGYLRDERVLRPSKVSVSQGPVCDEEDRR